MTTLSLSSSDINTIIDDPALLHNPSSVGISHETATYILDHGYTKGFSSLFILNACLTVLATLVSIVMIKNKELSRGDEDQLRNQAIQDGLDKKAAMSAKDLENGNGAPAELEELQKDGSVDAV
ncbi:hypothetical protein B0H10DRAFT_140908 [Mycena sp. CBHHK59/15]|nr:hypothetical protein B0H10DRAFT_140908 [Mycena sp. CBHHK59/15]